jgi:hypothetical protein
MATNILPQRATTGQPTRCRAGQLAITAGTLNKRQLVKVERRFTAGEIIDGLAYRVDGPAWIVRAVGAPLRLLNEDGTAGGFAAVTVFLDDALRPIDGELVGCAPRRHLTTGEACYV